MTMSMSTEAPITLRDTIVLSGNLSSRSGSGIQSNISIYIFLISSGYIKTDLKS